MTADRADDLTSLRAEMDALNQRLCAVLHERARLCRRIADHKRRHGLPGADPAREAAMLEQLLAVPADGFAPEALAQILRTVFAASRAIVTGDGQR